VDVHVGVEGSVEPRFAPVRDAFAEVVRDQPGTGAALAAWHDGRWVVDLWGGWADGARTQPWRRDSIVMPYSVSKPFAAMPALLLVDRGLLDLDGPAQRWWPELTAPATVRQLMSHQAGVVALDEPAPTELFYDWTGLCERLAAQTPAWPPGTAHGESALFYGHLVGELARRVDGRSPGALLRDEVCGPHGLDIGFGLDAADRARAVELTGFEAFAAQRLDDKPPLYERATSNPPGAFDPAVVNGERWRAGEIPAVNAHGTARAVAGLYVALQSAGLLSASLLAEFSRPQSTGVDRVFGHEGSWGLGVAVEADGYGMGGSGGSYGGWSRTGGYAIGFVTGSMGSHDRVDGVENVLRGCLGVPPLM
jgi:CubicO group peptidase (beta-lactamase class C family)